MEPLVPEGPHSPSALAPLLARPRYEVLPLPSVLDQTGALPEDTVVTVTASPRRGTGATVELCEKLAAQRLHAVPHLAARQCTGRGELREMLARLDGAGIEEVFVVGGDAAQPAGPYPDGLALLRAMADLGLLPARIGVPSYPEGHPSIPGPALWSALRAKQPFAHYTVTQLCLDGAAVCRFTATLREEGVDLPVVAGVPGTVEARSLLTIGLRIGVGDSLRFLRGHTSAAGRILRPGGYRPRRLLRTLDAELERNRCALAGLHFYTFNRVGATARWVRRAHRRATRERGSAA
ncbi:methylenetetrahydrofolate reductase (NADPH) [Prauserella shujinwangii]|uniref:Methylenetetrahydrofolate reductase n=1 Tax=Prauserella shujinwangii TaxID=1453103 RepID=A0A2T0M3Y8_9PSEU|nr:methylenetetrahydrofolate reductase [Prauserella shujinwangii]PRX51468.1 methylenetetrahydrofolate reductase (NADPH) [Prauserella shujinwangii]